MAPRSLVRVAGGSASSADGLRCFGCNLYSRCILVCDAHRHRMSAAEEDRKAAIKTIADFRHSLSDIAKGTQFYSYQNPKAEGSGPTASPPQADTRSPRVKGRLRGEAVEKRICRVRRADLRSQTMA